MTINRLGKLLDTGAGDSLNEIVRRAQDMDALRTALCKALTPEASENLVAANLRDDGEIVVICASSAWASRLRFEAENLLAAARAAGFAAQGLRVTVSQPR